MVDRRNNTLMDPPIEDLLDKVDSKFTLVALSAKRARQINSYYNQLGEGLGMVVPPQVTSVSGKPLTIAFEEISASKATYHRIDPDEEAEAEAGAAVAESDAIVAAVDLIAEEVLAEVAEVAAEVAVAEEIAAVAETVDEAVSIAGAPELDSAETPADE